MVGQGRGQGIGEGVQGERMREEWMVGNARVG